MSKRKVSTFLFVTFFIAFIYCSQNTECGCENFHKQEHEPTNHYGQANEFISYPADVASVSGTLTSVTDNIITFSGK